MGSLATNECLIAHIRLANMPVGRDVRDQAGRRARVKSRIQQRPKLQLAHLTFGARKVSSPVCRTQSRRPYGSQRRRHLHRRDVAIASEGVMVPKQRCYPKCTPLSEEFVASSAIEKQGLMLLLGTALIQRVSVTGRGCLRRVAECCCVGDGATRWW